MACPRCRCKETYQYDDEDAPDDSWERCAACGVVFHIEDHTDEDEEQDACGVRVDASPSDEQLDTIAAKHRRKVEWEYEFNHRAFAREVLASYGAMPSNPPVGWLYDWTHSSALGKPDEHFTGFTTDEAHARKHDNPRPVYAAPVASVPGTEGQQ